MLRTWRITYKDTSTVDFAADSVVLTNGQLRMMKDGKLIGSVSEDLVELYEVVED